MMPKLESTCETLTNKLHITKVRPALYRLSLNYYHRRSLTRPRS